MKQKTIDKLKNDLVKDKNKEEGFDKNKDFVYNIEFLPVLTKRGKNGNLEEVTNYSNRLLFVYENENN